MCLLVIFFNESRRMEPNTSENEIELTLPPLKKRHERKSFATQTLKMIASRLQYYRKILNEPESDNPKKMKQRERIQKKYDHCMKVRKLLNRAAANRYL